MTADEIHSELKIKTPVHKWWKREIDTLSLSSNDYSLREVRVHRGRKVECTFSKSAVRKIRERYALSCKRVYTEREHGALCAIEQLLGVKLIRQFKVSSYYIDGYDKKNNIAYEVDEGHHKSNKSREADKKRERDIRFLINCEFVRISV